MPRQPDVSRQRVTYPREHRDVARQYPPERLEFPRVRWRSGKHYKLGRKIGAGHFGEVFEAKNASSPSKEKVVIKTLKVEKKEKIKLRREIKMLELVRGGPNIIVLTKCIWHPSNGKKGLVFEKVEYEAHKELFARFSLQDVRFYCLELLKAIAYTHSLGIMHRDVKPSNILIDHRRHVLRLIDWGVAGFYIPDKKNGRGPGTRCYKSPELCLRYDYYDYSVDMWAVGCTLGSMLFLHHPLIRGKGSWFNQLKAITAVVGSAVLFSYMDALAITIDDDLMDELHGHLPRPWSSWVTEGNEHLQSPEGTDLVSKLILCDHRRRLTATEAMAHPFFDSVRDAPPPPPQESSSLYTTSSEVSSAAYETTEYYYSDEEVPRTSTPTDVTPRPAESLPRRKRSNDGPPVEDVTRKRKKERQDSPQR